MKPKLVVLTGGPCAGKTTVTQAITGEWPDKLIVAPEVASVLLEHLIPAPNEADFEVWLEQLQKAIFPTQRSCEHIQLLRAQRSGIQLVLCDRGVLDGAAYMPGGMTQFARICALDPSVELARYERVIHLESVATAKPELWDELKATNPARYETLELAQERELALRQVYQHHPKYHFVSGEHGIDYVVESVQEILGSILDNEIERKWRLDSLPAGLNLDQFRSVKIRQGYLTSTADGAELRIREIGQRHFVTSKIGKGIGRREWERLIPKAHFESLWPATDGRRIHKTRYLIPCGDEQIEFDVYDKNPAGPYYFELEFASTEEADAFVLPNWATGAVDVTEDESFKNKNLAS